MQRGFIGVESQDLTPELREALRPPQARGALVSSIPKGSPAENAGLERGDVVIAVGGQPVDGEAQLKHRIAETAPGTRLSIDVYRKGERKRFVALVADRPPPSDESEAEVSVEAVARQVGLVLRPVSPEVAIELGYQGRRGLVVFDVVPGGAGDRAGLLPGDLIEEVDGRSVEDPVEFERLAESRRGGRPLLLYVYRQDVPKFVAMKVE